MKKFLSFTKGILIALVLCTLSNSAFSLDYTAAEISTASYNIETSIFSQRIGRNRDNAVNYSLITSLSDYGNLEWFVDEASQGSAVWDRDATATITCYHPRCGCKTIVSAQTCYDAGRARVPIADYQDFNYYDYWDFAHENPSSLAAQRPFELYAQKYFQVEACTVLYSGEKSYSIQDVDNYGWVDTCGREVSKEVQFLVSRKRFDLVARGKRETMYATPTDYLTAAKDLCERQIPFTNPEPFTTACNSACDSSTYTPDPRVAPFYGGTHLCKVPIPPTKLAAGEPCTSYIQCISGQCLKNSRKELVCGP